MTVTQLADELSLTRLTVMTDAEVASCYISDLLSRVLGGVKSGDVWITVQSSINVIAVAVMTEASCVIFPEGVTAQENVLLKANEENLTVFSSQESAFALAKKLVALGL